jgi:hypothetical protein
MKVKKQGWINIYKEPIDGERFVGSVWLTKGFALRHWRLTKREMRRIQLQDTIQIEWEEEV